MGQLRAESATLTDSLVTTSYQRKTRRRQRWVAGLEGEGSAESMEETVWFRSDGGIVGQLRHCCSRPVTGAALHVGQQVIGWWQA